MASRELERIQNAVLAQRYVLTEHAYEEIEKDAFDALDLESALLTGVIESVQTKDPRGTRYVIVGRATDQQTSVGVVVRFVDFDQVLIITAYEIT